MSRSLGVNPGTSAFVESGRNRSIAGLRPARERPQVGDAVVEGQLVHLEVTRVQHHASPRLDGDRERVGNRVVDRDELEVERAERLVLALADRERVGRDAVLLELRLDERERQGRADERDVTFNLSRVRHGPDVVLVTVGEHDSQHVVEAVADRREVRKDQVDARLILLGEEHPAVDDKDLAVDLEGRHVATDLAETADRRDAESSGGELGRGEH